MDQRTNPENDLEKVLVMCISRTLSKAERNYSQIEKEALALVCACERLHIYLIGQTFKLFTDNSAVQLIFKNPLAKPPLRINHWKHRFAHF